MYRYKLVDQEIVKYKVDIDFERLRVYRNVIIKNCGINKKMNITTTDLSMLDDPVHFKNVSCTTLGFNDNDEEIFYVKYDYCEDPKIIKPIDKLLSGDLNAIDEIKNFVNEEELARKKTVEEFIDINKRLQDEDEEDISLCFKKLVKTYEKIRKYKVENYDRPLSVYYNELLSCINEKEEGKLDVKLFDQVKTFFENDLSNTHVRKLK